MNLWNLTCIFYLKTPFQQINKTGPKIDTNLILVILTSVLVLLGIITYFAVRKKPKPPRKSEFPFEIKELEDLRKYLEKEQRLTETQNIYFPRAKNIINQPNEKIDSSRKILIIGPASIGKTREALRIIEEELITRHDPCSILIPLSGTIPEEFLDEQIPNSLIGRTVILMCDELPNFYASSTKKSESKLATPQDKLQKIIEGFKAKTNQFHLIATARNELLFKLEDFDYQNDPLWNSFEISELCNLTPKSELDMINNLIDIYKIQINKDAIKRMQEINECASCESLVSFLKERADKKIEIEEINNDFSKDVAESWKKSSFYPLREQMPIIDTMFEVFKFIKFQIDSDIFESMAIILSRYNLKKKNKLLLAPSSREVKKALDFLVDKKCLDISENIIKLPDHRIESFYDLNYESQIRILIRKRNKFGKIEINSISYSLFSQGNSKYEEGEFVKAISDYDKAIELKPDDAEAWYNKGISLGKLERYEEALKAHDKAIELKPDDAGAWYNKGISLGKLERYEEAFKAYEKAIELKPDYARAWNNKGNSLGKLERYEEALKAYDKAIELKPDYAGAWYNKGNSLGKLERYEEALKAYEKAIELKPDDAEAWYNKACIHRILQDKEKAFENLSKAIHLDVLYKKEAKEDEDFKEYWDDEDFKKITSA